MKQSSGIGLYGMLCSHEGVSTDALAVILLAIDAPDGAAEREHVEVVVGPHDGRWGIDGVEVQRGE